MSVTSSADRDPGDFAVYCEWVAEAHAAEDQEDTTVALTSLYRHLVGLGWAPPPRAATLLRLQEGLRDVRAGRPAAPGGNPLDAAPGAAMGFKAALDERMVIAQAQGLLMWCHGIDAHTARQRLLSESQTLDLPLPEFARDLIRRRGRTTAASQQPG